MSGWIEMMVAGNCRAYLDCAQIRGVLTPSGLGADEIATPENPITLIMGSGETIPNVYGISVTRLLFRLCAVQEHMRYYNRRHVVAYLDNADAFDAEMASLMAGAKDAEAG